MTESLAGDHHDRTVAKDLVSCGNNGTDESFGLDELLGSSARTLGMGTFGYTYKVELKSRGAAPNINANAVVVKRFTIACVSENVFIQKVDALGRLVHENLLPFRAYHCDMSARRLIYDYMPIGNLSSLLHGRQQDKDKPLIRWEFRTSIAYGTARAIEYLHLQGPNFCHGNIRSSNVFLISFNHAFLSEFGSTQFVASASSKTNLIAGHCAPEVQNVHQVSLQSDVYSFDVLLLELLMLENNK